jgi:2'-5' RNA ligase
MFRTYSIVISPDAIVKDFVRELKEEMENYLQRKYASSHSEAHLSFTNFRCDERGIQYWEKYCHHFCKTQRPFDLHFDHWGFYPTFNHGTVCLLADRQSTLQLVPVMSQFNKNAPLSNPGATHKPHITIGRELTDEEVWKMETHWKFRELNITFTATGLTIRKFNENIRQYKQYKTYLFDANPQLSVFSV